MASQKTFVRPFSVRGGKKADLLWGLLEEMGIEDSAEDHRNAGIEFVSGEATITRPGSTVIYLAVEAERDHALSLVALKGWQGPIFVDAQGSERDVYKRTISRWLFGCV